MVDAGTAWRSVNNQATVTSNELNPLDTNLVSIPIVGSAAVTGRVFLDLDGDGVLDAGEPGIPNVDVVVTDATGVSQVATTDANGDYTCTVDVGCYRDDLHHRRLRRQRRDAGLVGETSWTEFRRGCPTRTRPPDRSPSCPTRSA